MGCVFRFSAQRARGYACVSRGVPSEERTCPLDRRSRRGLVRRDADGHLPGQPALYLLPGQPSHRAASCDDDAGTGRGLLLRHRPADDLQGGRDRRRQHELPRELLRYGREIPDHHSRVWIGAARFGGSVPGVGGAAGRGVSSGISGATPISLRARLHHQHGIRLVRCVARRRVAGHPPAPRRSFAVLSLDERSSRD